MKPLTSLRLLIGSCACVGALACGGDATGPAPADPSQLYWQLTLNHHAVVLDTTAGYDTVQLVATPRTVTGAPLTGGTNLQFALATADTSFRISPTGLVTAHSETEGNTPILVRVSLTVGAVTHTDSLMVLVNAVPTPPALGTLSVQPAVGTHVTVACGFRLNGVFTPSVLDAEGQPIPNAVVAYAVADPTMVTIDPWQGSVQTYCTDGGAPRQTMVYVTTTVYGASRIDSIPLLITAQHGAVVRWTRYGLSNACVYGPAFTTALVGQVMVPDVVIAVGGLVAWAPDLSYLPAGVASFATCGAGPVDVVFDHPEAAVAPQVGMTARTNRGTITVPPDQTGGNIAPFTAAPTTLIETQFGFNGPNLRVRQFPVVGTYHFHSARSGATGVIIVRDTLP